MDGSTATAKALYQRALQGCLTDLPKEESTTVRVFFSSTFTDMKVERNMLMKEAVSHLRNYCKDRGLDYEVVDMRWGVREDASVEHTTTDICRQEIANCQELSAGPNFVAFLGDRYGSRLLPSSIPVTEYRSLRRLASWMDVDDFGAADKWYIVDTNAVPALYRIQPITDLLPHYNDFDPKHRIVKQQHHQTWDRDHGKMMNAFRVVAAEAHKRKMITDKEYLKYYISVTHREVIDGMVDIPGMNGLNGDRVLSFHRNFTDININDKIAKRFIDLTEEAVEDSEAEVKVDANAEQLRKELKAEVVPSHLQGSNISENTIRWTEYGVYQEDPEHAAYLRTFCDVYMAKMMAMIDKCAQKKEVILNHSQELYEEVVAHLRFCKEKCRVFCGREQELQGIQAGLVTTHTPKKESTTKVQETNIKQEKDAETDEVEEAQEEEVTENNNMHNEMQGLMDMCKMTGATFCYGDTFDDQESDPTRDLKEEHISMPEIKTFKRPVVIHGPTGSGKTALMAKVVQMSKRWVPGSVCVARFLSTTTSSSYVRSTMISIIGQLLDLYGLHPPVGLDLSVDFHYLTLFFTALLWRVNSETTPLFLVLDSVDQLQANDYAHMLIWLPTMLPPNVHVFVSMSTDHPMCLRSALEVLPYEDQFIQLGGLDNNTADKIVRSLCHQVGRTLTASQRSHVLNTFAESGQALHLTLITNQALSWRSHHKLSDLQLAGTVEAAIEQYFCELEKTHGHIFVSHLLGYFTLAKYGLTNGEIEDLLSLDDEVLQDSYIYHLPPDPHMIRIPTSLIVRVSDDLSTYVTKQKSGERKISTWFHRQFKEAALRRYCTEESTPVLHRAMADYFLGTWSTRPKPLELYKGKTGSYENCLRGVPAQPLKYDGGNKTLFNVRKLQELPHHLAACGSWDEFHMLACDVEWLVAVCVSLGVTHLQSQFSAMLKCDMDDIEDEEIKQKARDVLLVQSIINLGIDDIRRDAVSVPVQILGQLGPQYKGSTGIEGLLRQCREYLASYKRSIFMPQNAFMPAPGGLLLSTINLRNFLMGAERECGQSVCVDESKHCLYAVEWSADRGTDSLLVLDYENTGVIMARQKLPFFIDSIELVTVNRFFVLKTYSKLSKYDPEFSYVLFEGGFSAPYIFEKPVTAMAIATHGHLIAFSFKDDRTVHMGLPESKACKVQVKQHMYMDKPIAVLLFSPDASELVGVDVMGNISTYNTTQRQAVTLHTNTERIFGSLPKPHQFRITRSNVLLRVVHSLSKGNAVVALDLANRREMHRMSSEKLIYDFDIMELDEQEEYMVVCTKATSIINGITDRPGLMFRLSDGVLMSTIESKESWQAAKLIGDETLFCVASYSRDGIIRVLNCGPRESPVAEPEIICELNDHSKSVFSLLLVQDNTQLVSSAIDNTMKFWDLARILREKNLVEEEDKLAWNKKKEKKEEEKTGVELLGRTTTVAVTGLEDSLAYFGTDKGVVACSKLENSEDVGIEVVTVATDLPPVHLMVLSRKGDYLMAAAGNTVAVFDARQAKLLYKMPGVDKQTTISCLAEGGNTAALGHGGMEGKVKLWDLKSGEVIKELSFLYSFDRTAVNRSGTQVIASMFEYPIVMNIYGEEKDQMAGAENLQMDKLDVMMTGLTFICISPDDRMVAACASNGSTRVVSMDNKYLHRLQQRSSPTYAVFTSDSQFLLTSGFRSIYVWRMNDGKGQLECKLTRHQDFVTCMRFALDDRFLISASMDRSVAVWDFKARATVCVMSTQCQIMNIHLLPDLSKLVYIPDRVAHLAVLKPNDALQRVLSRGRRLRDMADPEMLEQTSAFAMSFNTQKDLSETTSVACAIL